ncbi:MAG: family N-acetyltransferase [Polaromonas sp.]|nr:family N-acetyltransferase [Polaromonas sp.]
MPLNLHIASESDADEISTLVNRAYRPAPYERSWTHEADLVSGTRTSTKQVLSLFVPQSCILVLCTGPKFVACVHLQREESSVYIGMLATDPALQAQGLGKQMLLHAEQHALEHFNISTFKMSVLSSRLELMAFYERRGYVRTGEVEGYPVSAGVGRPLVEGLQVVALSKKMANSNINEQRKVQSASLRFGSPTLRR